MHTITTTTGYQIVLDWLYLSEFSTAVPVSCRIGKSLRDSHSNWVGFRDNGAKKQSQSNRDIRYYYFFWWWCVSFPIIMLFNIIIIINNTYIVSSTDIQSTSPILTLLSFSQHPCKVGIIIPILQIGGRGALRPGWVGIACLRPHSELMAGVKSGTYWFAAQSLHHQAMAGGSSRWEFTQLSPLPAQVWRRFSPPRLQADHSGQGPS